MFNRVIFKWLAEHVTANIVVWTLGMQKLFKNSGRHGTFLYTNGQCGKLGTVALFNGNRNFCSCWLSL